jgi:hypothetical protein
MLTHDALGMALKGGKLFLLDPIADWEAEPRGFLLCEPLMESIIVGRRDTDEKVRQVWARLEAAIRYFVEGGYVTRKFMKQLVPPKYEHWELICRRPRPSLRVFGRFAHPDIFVGTHVVERKLLGGMWSPEFEHEKLVCEDYWKDAGLPDPFTDAPGFRYEEYITSNASADIKITS